MNKYYEKKTLVTINSNDRIKNNKILTLNNPNKITTNGLKIIDYDTILVEHPNHNYEINNTNQVIFKNIIGTFNTNLNKYTVGGIPVDFLNYNSIVNKPIFNIEIIYTYVNNIKVSNSYKIKIPININKQYIIINSTGGGSDIKVELVQKFIKGFEDASDFKIMLPRRFINIKNVKLINIEMSNAQYAIRDTINKKDNNKNNYIKHNNFLHWINSDNLIKLKNNILINNEKLLEIINNNTVNIPETWTRNNTKETTLIEHLSDVYLNKINVNFENMQYDFINILYHIKNAIINSTSKTNDYFLNNELISFNINNINYYLYLTDRVNTTVITNTVKYYIDDFYNKETLVNFIYIYTNYNSILNTYNTDLNINFIGIGSNNIYNDLSINYATNYYNFLNNSSIELPYSYIKYLFNTNINLLLKELLQYNYSNINNSDNLENYKNDFISYLNKIYNIILNTLDTLDNTIIQYGYIISFYYNKHNKIYQLYFYNKPDNSSNIINYNIIDLRNSSTFINFISYYIESNLKYTLDFINYDINTYIYKSPENIIKSNIYEIPHTNIIINNTNINKNTYNKINIYRNIEYILNFSDISNFADMSNIIVTSSVDVLLKYNFNNNVIYFDNKIKIKVSNYENINNLYLVNKETTKIILTLTILGINNYKTDFSIYGYIHNISLNNKLDFLYNNTILNYTVLDNSFIQEINNLNIQINNIKVHTYSLLDTNTKPNLDNQFYWILPNKLETSIYTSSINNNITIDCMIENRLNYNDLINIKYVNNTVNIYNIYPIYSVQISKGNYIIDEFINELKNKLNSVANKKYSFKEKIFIDDSIFNIKTLLKDKKKNIFDVEFNESNNLIKIYQYNILYSYSLLDIKTSNQSGPLIVNENYPYIFVKFKNHLLKTGDMIKIENASSMFNLTTYDLNKKHVIYTHEIYRGYIRFILPLDNNNNPTNIDENYFFEGNTFINYSNYKYGLNKIYSNNEQKNNIGNTDKVVLLDKDISIYELFTDINNLNIEIKNNTKLGRVLNITKDTEITENGVNTNYIIDYSLLSKNNFKIGDIIKTSNTNTYAMFVPQNWNKSYLPKEYNIINSNIEKLENINEGFSIKLDKLPNQSSLEGSGGISIVILKAIKYSFLFNEENTLNDVLGFENKMTDFSLIQSNTYKINENIIDYSYIEPTFFKNTNSTEQYIMLKLLVNHNYDIGGYVKINNHNLNYNLVSSYKKQKLYIVEYIPFIVWYNDLSIIEQINIKNTLTTGVFENYCKKGIILHYKYPYTKLQIQDLGNIGMPISNYDNIDYFNFKETPIPNIYNLKPNTYIFINENQKTIIRNIDGIDISYKIGLRDGYYKILNNLPISKSSYYKNYFNNTNTCIIECNYIIITENSNLNTLNYNEKIISNTNDQESILEGYLNNGEILYSSLNTNIAGNVTNNNYNDYKTTIFNQIDNNKINVFFPLKHTNYFYLTYNNHYFINNNNINTIDIYKNTNYIFDISDISLLNKNIIISIDPNNILPYITTNNNINITGIPGNSNVKIDLNIVDEITTLYLFIDYILIYTLNIIQIPDKIYTIKLLKYNVFEFKYNNVVLLNPIINILFGYKYKFKFIDINTYNNFLLITDLQYNIRFISDYIKYDNINLYIEIHLTNNNYKNEIYYQLNNTSNILGKFILGINNYYNTDRILLCNSKYIDNINNMYIDNINVNKNIDINIINYIDNISNYTFTIHFKNNINNIENTLIPHLNISFLNSNCIKNTNTIQIKKLYDILSIYTIKSNIIYLKEPNYNLRLNNIIELKNNIPNTLLKINTFYYVIFIDTTYSQIKLGNIIDKSLVLINDSGLITTTIEFYLSNSYDYKTPNELINKSIKINYLSSYDNLIDKSYNSTISKLNNTISNIKYLNISNNIYYNYVSPNINIISNNLLKNLNWTTPYGTIYIDLSENNIINYIKFKNIQKINNHPYKVYLYYIESNITNYIGSITDVLNNNIFLNNTYNKNKYIIYIESYSLYKNTEETNYSELIIEEIELGYINPIKTDIVYLQDYITRLAINNIVNKYNISDNYLDLNTLNEKNVLLLNNTKSSIIDIFFEEPTTIKYYKILQNIENNTLVQKINNSTITYEEYKTIFSGTITSIQLFGSNNIDYNNEIEIVEAKYINSKIVNKTGPIIVNEPNLYMSSYNTIVNYEKKFTNDLKFKYYRFKIISNINYYPYLKPVTNNTNIIENENILLNNITDNYIFNYENNYVNIDKNIFNLNISGIVVGDYNVIDYSKLYIEDINYITDAKIYESYIDLTLKYNLLNSHLEGENIVISSSETQDNFFSTQNLIIYNKWYTRIFYQGYDTLYNSNHINRTEFDTFIDLTVQSNNNINIYSNSKYTFKYIKNLNELELYEITLGIGTTIGIGTIYNNNNIVKIQPTNIYDNNIVYVTYNINNISYKYIESNKYKLILAEKNSITNLQNIDINNYIILNPKKNNNKEGIPILQDFLTNNIHIDKMNGYFIPEVCYKLKNNTIEKFNNNNIITPVKTSNYDTYTYTNLDLVFKSDYNTLNIDSNSYINGTPLFGVFLVDNTYYDKYDTENYYINYYSITIEGKHLGFGGQINSKISNSDNLFNNNLEDFKIIDIGYDNNNNRNIVKLDLRLSELGINSPEKYLGNINTITDNTEKNKYIIGYGGNIYQNNIYKNIDALSGPRYLYLSINKLNTILSTSNINYFAKIMLKTTPGNHLYESEFIMDENMFEKQPLDELTELEIKFINDENKLFDLGKTEYSMTLEITEYIKDFDNSNYLL